MLPKKSLKLVVFLIVACLNVLGRANFDQVTITAVQSATGELAQLREIAGSQRKTEGSLNIAGAPLSVTSKRSTHSIYCSNKQNSPMHALVFVEILCLKAEAPIYITAAIGDEISNCDNNNVFKALLPRCCLSDFKSGIVVA